jgi:hypothetical protein
MAMADQAADGVMLIGRVDRVKVSPLDISLLGERAPVHRQFPAVLASHREMWLRVSAPTAHAVQDTDAVRAIASPDGALNPTSFRVVSADAFAAPVGPGSPVCSFTYTVEMLKLVARRVFNHPLAMKSVRPSAMTGFLLSS